MYIPAKRLCGAQADECDLTMNDAIRLIGLIKTTTLRSSQDTEQMLEMMKAKMMAPQRALGRLRPEDLAVGGKTRLSRRRGYVFCRWVCVCVSFRCRARIVYHGCRCLSPRDRSEHTNICHTMFD